MMMSSADRTWMLLCTSELKTGADASKDRAHLDTMTNCIIVPDVGPVLADGLLVSWNVFARQPGVVALDVRTYISFSSFLLRFITV